MKFNFEKYKDQSVAIHCKTEEEAIDFCRVMDEYGLKWKGGDRYTERNSYNVDKERTCYDLNGCFSGIDYYKTKGYEILEWSDFMNKQFTKSDLRNGDVLVKRNGRVEIAIPEVGATLSENGGYNLIDFLDDDLTGKGKNKECYDVMKVYRPKVPYQCSFKKSSFECGELVFDRAAIEPVEVTLEEIAKLKGVSVDRIKIVNG